LLKKKKDIYDIYLQNAFLYLVNILKSRFDYFYVNIRKIHSWGWQRVEISSCPGDETCFSSECYAHLTYTTMKIILIPKSERTLSYSRVYSLKKLLRIGKCDFWSIFPILLISYHGVIFFFQRWVKKCVLPIFTYT